MWIIHVLFLGEVIMRVQLRNTSILELLDEFTMLSGALVAEPAVVNTVVIILNNIGTYSKYLISSKEISMTRRTECRTA